MPLQSYCLGCFLDNAESLTAANGSITSFPAGKEEGVFGRGGGKGDHIVCQCIPGGFVENNNIAFSRLLFCDSNMRYQLSSGEIINISPFQLQNIGDPKGGIQSEYTQCIISDLRMLFLIILFKFLKLFRIPELQQDAWFDNQVREIFAGKEFTLVLAP